MAPAYRSDSAIRIERVIGFRIQVALSVLYAFLGPTILLGGVLVVSGCHEASKLTRQEMEGKHLYQGRCAHCHEDNDLGLKKAPPDLHFLFKTSKLPSGSPSTDSEIRRVVLAGKGMMPAFTGRFDEAQMSALLAYLHTDLR